MFLLNTKKNRTCGMCTHAHDTVAPTNLFITHSLKLETKHVIKHQLYMVNKQLSWLQINQKTTRDFKFIWFFWPLLVKIHMHVISWETCQIMHLCNFIFFAFLIRNISSLNEFHLFLDFNQQKNLHEKHVKLARVL